MSVPERPVTLAGMRRAAIVSVPLLVFLALAALLYGRLQAGDSSRIPSALLGRPVPAFSLPALGATPALGDADLRGGTVTVLNVFASWCLPCRAEHPVLEHLSRDAGLAATGVRVVGLDYKDRPEAALKFLDQEGNPYAKIGLDETGRTGVDFGVYGVPETFVVRGDGTIAYKFVGPLDEASMAGRLLPEIARAMR